MVRMPTLRQAAGRGKPQGLPGSEYRPRSPVKRGEIPARYAALFDPNVVRDIRCADGCGNPPVASGKG